jgi:hypothetical protein
VDEALPRIEEHAFARTRRGTGAERLSGARLCTARGLARRAVLIR